MPHWYAIIDTSSPPLLESCGGDPIAVRRTIMQAAPQGVNVRALSWKNGEDRASIIVEGPYSEDFLRNDLQAEEETIVELLNAHERKEQRGVGS